MRLPLFAILLLTGSTLPAAETVALWLFDEPVGLYPSTPLECAAGIDAPLVLGLGGSVVPGRFGQALSTQPFPPVTIPSEGQNTAALHRFPVPAGRTMEPLSWHNAQFTALMTSGERQIRREVTFAQVTRSDLNLGDFDWTVEFWLRADPRPAQAQGVVLELGTGPRGENDIVTRLSLEREGSCFVWENPGSGRIIVPSAAAAIADTQEWHHYAFVHDSARGLLVHFVDGQRHGDSAAVGFHALPIGDEDYLTLGRDARWKRPLGGALDEMRISRGAAHTGTFVPTSLATDWPKPLTAPGLPLLFASSSRQAKVIELGSRRHLFLDDSLIERKENIGFNVHPPQRIEPAFAAVPGPFRKHLTAIEDEKGLIRIYNGGPDDYLMVHTSTDGVHFTAPDTGVHHKGRRNIV
ncbi:MAG: LamG domain-containing protein, partial [Opitutaceae bacterium]|nr:LamG domain-containing protein [Opitutaceae bacterium]